MSLHKITVFTGVATALITPHLGGEIDYDAFGNLIDLQIGAGIGALLVAGTTGESATLRRGEFAKLIAYAKARIDGRVPLLVGCGSNSTEHTLELADIACLSPTYFSSVFKKFNGISLWEYISIKRVERAVDMLKNEKITKLEVAERCGFSSSSNFYKTFTAITGKRPGDFTD